MLPRKLTYYYNKFVDRAFSAGHRFSPSPQNNAHRARGRRSHTNTAMHGGTARGPIAGRDLSADSVRKLGLRRWGLTVPPPVERIDDMQERGHHQHTTSISLHRRFVIPMEHLLWSSTTNTARKGGDVTLCVRHRLGPRLAVSLCTWIHVVVGVGSACCHSNSALFQSITGQQAFHTDGTTSFSYSPQLDRSSTGL